MFFQLSILHKQYKIRMFLFQRNDITFLNIDFVNNDCISGVRIIGIVVHHGAPA